MRSRSLNWRNTAAALFSVAAIISTIALSGCGNPDKNEMRDEGNRFAVPEAVLQQLRISLVEGDEKLFLSCFTKSPSTSECLRQVFRKAVTVIRLQAVIDRVYGVGSWEEFQEQAEQPGPSPKLVPEVVPTEKEWWDQIEIRVNDNEAAFFNPLTQLTNVMVRLNGQWTIETKSMFGAGVDCAKLADYLKTTADAVEEITAEIQAEKIPIQEVGSRLFERASEKRKPQR